MQNLTILSRKSPLARIQAKLVANEISKSLPKIKIEYIFKSSLGDLDQDTPLDKMPDIGVFTNDIREDLISNKADIAVHSWKDLPIDFEEGTEILGTLQRADMRDMVFFKKFNLDKKDLSILSSSPRRKKNLSAFLPKAMPLNLDQINFKEVRGNIHTRFKKFLDGEEDGLVVAKAAIDRILHNEIEEFARDRDELLGMVQELNWMVIPLSENPCAAAQGALAIECRSNDNSTKEIIKSISSFSSMSSIEEERKILQSYGGGCHQKIGSSVEVLETGLVKTTKGETEEGRNISKRFFVANKENKTFFSDVSEMNYFPASREEQSFFKRVNLQDTENELPKITNKGIYVSRSNAIGESIKIDDSNIIWTSGVDTWISLAMKGFWVNGTSDSLGEKNSPGENPFKDMDWLKVSHADAENRDIDIIATYKLEPLELKKRMQSCEYFYWMSASSFKLAIDTFPEILTKKHSCGLGNTYDFINGMIPENTLPCLNYDSWLEQIKANH